MPVFQGYRLRSMARAARLLRGTNWVSKPARLAPSSVTREQDLTDTEQSVPVNISVSDATCEMDPSCCSHASNRGAGERCPVAGGAASEHRFGYHASISFQRSVLGRVFRRRSGDDPNPSLPDLACTMTASPYLRRGHQWAEGTYLPAETTVRGSQPEAPLPNHPPPVFLVMVYESIPSSLRR